MEKLTLGNTELKLPKTTSFSDSRNWTKQQFEKTQGSNDLALQQLEASNAATQKIIDKAKNGQLAQNQDAMFDEKQKRFNDYYMRLNGRVSRDDAGSILGGFVNKADYQARMDAAKQYAATQQKPDLTDLTQFQNAMYDRQEARNELDKLNEQRRIDRERLGQGIGEFSAMLGDIAKASGGALVTPRTIEQKLAQLGERERNAYKLYTANQQRIEEDKLKALKDQEEKAYQLQKLEIEEAGKDARAEDANAAKLTAAYMRMGYPKEQAAAKAKAQMKYEGNLFFPSFIVSYEKNGKINKESTNKAIYQLIENYVKRNPLKKPKLSDAWKYAKDLGNKSTNLFGTGTKDYEAIIQTFIQHNDYDTAIDDEIIKWAEEKGVPVEKLNAKPVFQFHNNK